jgi:transcription elongation factor S-II
MPSLSTIVLSIKGEIRKANLSLTPEGKLNIDILQKYFKKKDAPERICSYEYDNKVFSIFGYKKGKKGTENGTEFPEYCGDISVFGDATVIVSLSNKWEEPVPFTIEQWAAHCKGDNRDDDEDNEDDDDEDEDEEILSAQDDDVEEDAFDEEESEKNTVIEEDEPEDIPVPVKRKRATTYNKVDTSAIKEEIPLNSEPESNKLRMLCLTSLSFLENNFSKDDICALERAIFETAYNYALKNYIARSWKSPVFIETYRQIVRSIMSNIHPESPVKNPRLLKRILDGEFKLYEIPSMTSYELYPEKWFELKDKLLQREQKILEGNKSRATDQFKCRRCGKRECTYYELQTRSADEPMTIFVTCLNCGKEWRNGG